VPSKAFATFQENRKDAEALLDIHEEKSGDKPGRKFGVEPLNKATIVFVCAAWEAYCEDIVAEAIDAIVADCQDPKLLPKELRKHITAQVRQDKNETAPWELAVDGWKQVLKMNAAQFTVNLTGRWSTPKPTQVQELFLKCLGIPDITAAWSWQKCDNYTARKKLDYFVTLRGAIAHRLNDENAVYKKQGVDFAAHVERLASIIDLTIRDYLFAVVGKHLW
jgi:hypothetical protein